MTTKRPRPNQADELRRRAEAQAATREAGALHSLTPEEAQRLLFELQVHQVELEMQNEELRRAQFDLAASQEKYFDLYNLAPVAYFTLDEKGLILETNLTAASLLGVTRNALVARRLTSFILPEDNDVYYLRRTTLFATGTPQSFELRMLREGCAPFWARVEATTAVGADGTPLCRAVMSDISERKRSEDALRNADLRYRMMFEHSSDGMVILDPATARILEFNAAAHRQLGYSREEFARLSVRDLDVVETPEETRSRIEKVVRDGASSFETRHRTRAGEIRNVQVTAQSIEGSGGRLYHCVWRDITEQKRAEEAMERKTARLYETQKMETVGRLAGGVAHNLNNILQVILSQVQLLQIVDPSPETAAAVAEVEAQIRRGASLTRELLLFSGNQVPQYECFDLNQVVTIGGAVETLLAPGNIRLVTEVAPGPLWVTGDAEHLQQALVNLALNARDAMPSGGVLTVRAGSDGLEVFLEVTDTGHGMDETTQQHLFEPFFTTREAGRGSGLGLAAVRGVVQQHGGRIEVWSRPGEGSRFRGVRPAAPAQPAAEAAAAPATTELPRGQGERVLVVEDEEGARTGMTKVLMVLGYQVTAVASAAAALALAAGPGFALLLSDVMLPGILGFELADRLVALWPALRVVMMSGYTSDIAVRRGLEGREVHFLQKPFGMAVLARKMRAALGDPPTTAPASPRLKD